MKIIYRPHLKQRIKERLFPHDYPKKIYTKATLSFIDSQTNHQIAITRLKYAGKIRNLAISYDIINKSVEIITIHPISNEELQKRINLGRWRRNEEKKR